MKTTNFFGISNDGTKRQARSGTSYREDAKSLGSSKPLYPAKLRACRKCKAPTHNYYRCSPCHTLFDTLDEGA